MTKQKYNIMLSVGIALGTILIICGQYFRPFTCVIDNDKLTLVSGLYSLFISLPFAFYYAYIHLRRMSTKDIRQHSKVVVTSFAIVLFVFISTSLITELFNKVFAEKTSIPMEVYISDKYITHTRFGHTIHHLTFYDERTSHSLQITQSMYNSVSAERSLRLMVQEGFFGYRIVVGFVSLSGKEILL